MTDIPFFMECRACLTCWREHIPHPKCPFCGAQQGRIARTGRKGVVMTLYVIYDRPADYPDNFAVRAWHIHRDGTRMPDKDCQLATSLESARALVPQGLTWMNRWPDDEPQIVEAWL